MQEEIKNKLDQIIDKSFLYGGKTITVKRYIQLSTGTIVIKTDSRSFSFFKIEIEEFINDLIPVKSVKLPQSFRQIDNEAEQKLPAVPSFNYQKSENYIKIEKSLADMIDKVITDVSTIPQATALCNIANTIINLEKQQLNFLRATKQIK